MKTSSLAAVLSIPLAVFAEEFKGVVADPVDHSVKFSAVSTDCGLDMQLEFLFTGPGSDRDYESMFTTDSPVKDIQEAFKNAGIPAGTPFDAKKCNFWPAGETLQMEPSFASLVREMRGDATPDIIFCGGACGEDGVALADKESPNALFALYNCSQSLVQLDDFLDQSPTYGRFQPAVKIPKGERRVFVFKWDGKKTVKKVDLEIKSRDLSSALEMLKNESQNAKLEVACSFDPGMTLDEAVDAANVLSMIDSKDVKINGADNFYYRAFLPLEKWRERSERLSQPPEVVFLEEGKIKVNEIKEDWTKDDSLDPVLTVVSHEFDNIEKAAEAAAGISGRTFTCLVFAKPSTRLGDLFAFKKAAGDGILNWYVFRQ